MRTTFDNPTAVPPPAGNYSHVARLDLGHDTLLWVSGQLALDHDHLVVGPGDMTAQTRQVFEILGAILAAHGASFKDVVNIRTYLVDMDRVSEYGTVRREYLTAKAPSSTTVGVTTLVIPGALVEVDVTAVVGGVSDSANELSEPGPSAPTRHQGDHPGVEGPPPAGPPPGPRPEAAHPPSTPSVPRSATSWNAH